MKPAVLPRLEKTRRSAGIRNSFGRFLLSAIPALLLSLPSHQFAYAGTNEPPSSPAAKHLILIIGDGMQLEHERAANMYLFGNHASGLAQWDLDYKGAAATWDVTTYNRYALAAGKGRFPRDRSVRDCPAFDPLLGYDPARGGTAPYPIAASGDPAYYGTRLNDGGPGRPKYPGTDSASAATALATGCKTDDGTISWRTGDPDDGRLTTIAEICRGQRRAAIGIVSTVPFSHATPAAFVSHNKSRKNTREIAAEILNVFKPEVVISGGHPLFFSSDPAERYLFISPGLYQRIRNGDEYVVAERSGGQNGGVTLAQKADEAVRTGKKLFGLFGGRGGNFEYHRPTSDGSSRIDRGSSENPTLAEAAGSALKVLSRNPNGFFLMIEQGDIDWSNHDNDFAGMIGGVWDLNEAVKAVIDFVDRPGDAVDWQNTLLIVTADHANSFMRISTDPAKQLGKGRLPNQQRKSSETGRTPYGAWSYPNGEVSYGFDGRGVNSHTNEPVMVYARGAGSQLFRGFEGAWYPGTRLLDNTHLYEVMLKALGLNDGSRSCSAFPGKNPSSPEAASRAATPASGPLQPADKVP